MIEAPHLPLRLMLVEDNAAEARLIREALCEGSEACIELETVETLRGCLDRLPAYAPHVVLLDLGLPDASGLEALYAVTRAAPHLPVVVLTGSTDVDTALRALRAGAQDYLSKAEIDGSLLARALRYSIERKRLQQAENFITGAAQLLGSSLRLEETLEQMADLSVTHLADYCAVDLLDDEGNVERLLVAHRDPARAPLAEELRKVVLDRRRPHLALDAMARRKPILIQEMTEEHLLEIAQTEDHARLLRSMAIRSYLAVPLLAGERVLGVLVLVGSTRHLGNDDLALSLRFAGIAAAAIHNARLYEQLGNALGSRDRVLGVVAHDLRNPLSTIAMGADLLLETALPEAVRHRQIDIIRRSAERMNRLIEDLLDVARIEHGSLTLELSYRHPEAIVEDVVEANSALAASRELILEANIDSAAPVLVDYGRLVQVLSNLIGNSLKFTPAGGSIRVGVEKVVGAVRFFVADDGPGIPLEDLERLFSPFWQGHRNVGQGAGLGLSIARGIVEAHGGRIWAESTVGQGTTMSFTIPLAGDRRESVTGEELRLIGT